MKKLLSILVAAALITALLAGCATNDTSANSGSSNDSSSTSNGTSNGTTTVESIKKVGKLVVATSPDFPPYEYMQGSTPVGIDMDIAKAIADDMGVELQIDIMDFDGVLAAISTGKCDLGLSALSVQPDRIESMEFSDKYFDSTVKILVRIDSDIKTSADLAGKKVAVQLGTISDSVSVELGANVTRMKKDSEGIMELQNGRVDAVVTDAGPAAVYAANNPDTLFMLEEDLASEDIYSVATKKGNKDLIEQVNKTIKRLLDEGKIEEFIENHKDAE